MSQKIVFIGAGNLATHLSLALKKTGFPVIQVYSKTEKSAKMLAEKLSSTYTTLFDEIATETDIYIIALKDSVFDDVLPQLNFGNKLVVHCSGSLPLAALEKYAKNYGVIYPLQTFSKNREINFREIPVFVETNSSENERMLVELTKKISDKVSILDSVQRMYLHVAAVFVCNFVNHFYTIASEILKSKNVPFEVLRPLILETAEKVQVLEPVAAQTGPAIRFDENIISKHLSELKGKKNYDELYRIISKSIFEHHQKDK